MEAAARTWYHHHRQDIKHTCSHIHAVATSHKNRINPWERVSIVQVTRIQCARRWCEIVQATSSEVAKAKEPIMSCSKSVYVTRVMFVVAILNANAIATVVFTTTAAFLPAFFSNFWLRVDSSASLITLPHDDESCGGKRAAKSSIAASTTAVAGGGGSGHSFSATDADWAWQSRRGSCSQDPITGCVIYKIRKDGHKEEKAPFPREN